MGPEGCTVGRASVRKTSARCGGTSWDPRTREAEPREIIELSRPPELHSFRLVRASGGEEAGREGEAVNIYYRFRLRALEGSAINRQKPPHFSSADLGLEGDSQGTFRGLGYLGWGWGSSVVSVPTDAIGSQHRTNAGKYAGHKHAAQ